LLSRLDNSDMDNKLAVEHKLADNHIVADNLTD
jgi:hypothetical protein